MNSIKIRKGSDPTDIINTCFKIGCTLKMVSEIFVETVFRSSLKQITLTDISV